MPDLTNEQIDVVINWMNSWEQLRDTAIPIRFKEDFTKIKPMTTDNKVYILQKDLPRIKAGSEGIVNESGILCFTKKVDGAVSMPAYAFPPQDIIDFPDWFKLKEAEEDKRIVVMDFHKGHSNSIEVWYYLATNIEAPQEKYEAVKKAIEFVINDTKRAESIPTLDRQDSDIWITKEKLDAMMEEVWDNARLSHPLAGMKFSSFKDYYESLPENKLPIAEQPKPLEKPPLGLIPDFIWKEKRLGDIKDAIKRYTEAKMPVPLKWVAEQYEIEQWIERREEN